MGKDRSDVALVAIFRTIDRNRNGYVTIEDLRRLKASKHLDPRQLQGIFTSADLDQDGKISKAEFIERVRRSKFFMDAQALFGKLDMDGSGAISREEAIYHLTSSDITASTTTVKEVVDMMMAFDLDQDQKLDFTEFLLLLTRVEYHLPILHALANTGGEAKYGLPIMNSLENLEQVAVDIVHFDEVAGVSTNIEKDTSTRTKGIYKVFQTLLCGACAGMIAKTAVAPFMRVKLLFQVTDLRFSMYKAADITSKIIRTEGFLSLWRGNSAVLARTLPYVSIHFLAHDLAEDSLRSHPAERLPAISKFIAGAFAGVMGTVCTYPLDLVRARLAVGKATTWEDIGREIYTSRGILGFYRGLSVTLVGIVPYTGIAWTIKGKLNERLREIRNRKLDAAEKLCCGAMAGLVAQACTYPMEMVRRRMQMPISEELGNTSIRQTVRTLVRKEGPGSLFKGFSLNVVKGPIAIGISFATFDTLKEWFGLSGKQH
ncbi:hypothetical protein AAMO2058_000331800 [Amorphochlora amoebiformis]|mmetsp:Transcript_1652/g.2344  ORF Transcript_1652/g.2344 Transcript_1652/m.2344 type:complete len:487 (-) Transcript_1652:128-1588(-)